MSKDGMNYAPQGKPQPVVSRGEFVFAATHLDHGHIYGMCNGLIEAGAVLKLVYDSAAGARGGVRGALPWRGDRLFPGGDLAGLRRAARRGGSRAQ